MGGKCRRILKKYYEYAVTKLKVWRNQKHFRFDDVDLKYMCKTREGAETLVVVFSACTRVGLAARYNYVKTLQEIACNQLFILDDFVEDRRGSFYLGHMPEFKEQEACVHLVEKIIKETSPKQILFCGSCKGGYGALNIGSRFKDAVMIIGEPTYRIATEFGLATELMHYWMGEITEEKTQWMDRYLSLRLKDNEYKASQRIHLFYSICDEYYEPQTKYLLEDLHRFGYQLEEETADFAHHGDLSVWFPEFLCKQIGAYTVS